jgi:type IV fimbrial biogenesis protein FimT
VKTYRNPGFSLIELLIALTLSGIFCLYVIPSLHDFIVKNNVLVRVNHMVNVLQFARNVAFFRSEVITFCKSQDQKTCCKNCAWRDGQIVVDHNNNVLQVISAVSGGDTLTWRGSLGKNDALQFFPEGSVSAQGSFIYCPKNLPEYSRAIVVNLKGRVYAADCDAVIDAWCGKD